MKKIISSTLTLFMLSATNLAFSKQKEFNLLVSANGYSAVVFSTVKKRISAFYPSIYRKYDEKSKEITFILRSLDYNININEKSFALKDAKLNDLNYIPGTGIIKVSFSHEIADVVMYIFSSFNLRYPSFVVKLEISPKERGIIEVSRSIGFSGRQPIVPYDNESQYINSEYGTLLFYFKEVAKKGIEFSIYDLVILAKDLETCLKVANYYYSTFFDPLEEELKFWNNWHSKTIIPKNLSKEQTDLYKQSLAFIKMGQVREEGKGFGQILASLTTGTWNIAWVRDGVYSIVALIRAGQLEEARDALKFFLEADTGYYKSYVFDGKDWGIGVDYKISVCRYYGNGKEESDDNGNGVNIEIDGFGMFLWALSEYLNATNDSQLLNRYFEAIDKQVIYPIIYNIDTNLNTIRPESGPWERHIRDNGYDGAKRFTYTTIMAIKGLSEISKTFKKYGKKSSYDIDNYISILMEGLNKNLVDKDRKVLVGSYEHFTRFGYPKYVDGAVVEAINFGLVSRDVSENTLKAFEDVLKMKGREGYKRNLDGGWYDNQEWVIINLRTASAYKRIGNTEKATRLVRRIEEKALNGFYMIPELLDEKDDSFKGAIPMLGFGAGAYIIFFTD
ncbi:MAG: glycoside hydrolase family 15 protein [Spirochaetia bacterium]|nr:glycoside hydrolase family 15 protein [Spirochaetota bacterium]MDW8113117.1 glycoside hydrolase family 15 protein [Spirochaetia bacterium]